MKNTSWRCRRIEIHTALTGIRTFMQQNG